MRVTSDACPTGMGAYLTVNNVILFWFAIQVTQDDRDILGLSTGSSSQQACEALAVLIALKLWFKFWATDRMRLHVRTDNVTTIALLARLKVSGRSLRTIGKELAVLLASASFEPDVVQHTPGVQNQLADYLSRRYENQHWSVPEPLADAEEVFPPRRSREWWITLSRP